MGNEKSHRVIIGLKLVPIPDEPWVVWRWRYRVSDLDFGILEPLGPRKRRERKFLLGPEHGGVLVPGATREWPCSVSDHRPPGRRGGVLAICSFAQFPENPGRSRERIPGRAWRCKANPACRHAGVRMGWACCALCGSSDGGPAEAALSGNCRQESTLIADHPLRRHRGRAR